MNDVKIKKVNNYMAILRNLRNISKAGVSAEHIDKVAAAIAHPPAVVTSKQLPFRFYAAHQMLCQNRSNEKLINAVEDAMQVSLENLPKLEGKVMCLTDNSGSAHGTFTSSMGQVKVADAGNVISLLTAMVADEGQVGVFGDRLDVLKVDSSKSFFEQLGEISRKASKIGQGTETGIWTFWEKAIREKEHFDHVFVYSDMQAGHGELYARDGYSDVDMTSKYVFAPTKNSYRTYSNYVDVPKLISEYREKVNPNVRVYLVQTAGYSDTIVPEVYDKTYILGGWSDGIIRYAHKMTTMGS